MHTSHIKVRGFHLDVYNHVNNARFLEFLEEARWSFFEKYPLTKEVHSQNLAFVLANININYRRPALLNEILEIQSCVERIGNKSCTIKQVITIKGTETIIADAQVTFCVLDQGSHKTLEIDGKIRSLLESMS